MSHSVGQETFPATLYQTDTIYHEFPPNRATTEVPFLFLSQSAKYFIVFATAAAKLTALFHVHTHFVWE